MLTTIATSLLVKINGPNGPPDLTWDSPADGSSMWHLTNHKHVNNARRGLVVVRETEGKCVDRHTHCVWVGVLVLICGQTFISADLHINRGHYHVGIIKTLCLLILSPMFSDDFWLRLGRQLQSSRSPNEIQCRWEAWAASLQSFF